MYNSLAERLTPIQDLNTVERQVLWPRVHTYNYNTSKCPIMTSAGTCMEYPA